jgi:hypothetical protein
MATLTIGGVSTTYSVTVGAPLAANQTPDPFTIPPVSGADTAVWVESAPVTLTGFSAPTPINIVAADNTLEVSYFVPEWGAFASGGPNLNDSVSLFPPGQPLRVRLMPQSYGRQASVTVEVGGRRATFVVNVRANDATPDAFNFADHLRVAPGSTIASESLTLQGFDSPLALTATGCTASIGGRIPSVAQGTVNPGETVALQITAPSASGASATCTVSIGGVSDTVNVTTSGSGGGSASGGGGGGGGGGAYDWLSILALVISLSVALKRRMSWPRRIRHLPSALPRS